MARSIGAVLLGFVLIAALSLGADFALHAAFPQLFDVGGAVSDPAVLLAIQGYVAVFAVFGCYVAARLAPSRPMLHALVLGALGLAFNVAGTIANWEHAPVWYHVMSLALVMPYAWAGGRLRERDLARGAHARLATA